MNKLIYNSISGVIQKFLTTILVFVSVPIFILNLGVDNYGLFTIVSVIGNLNVFANFGLNTALLVFLSKQGQCKQSNCDIVASLIFVTIVATLLMSALWYFKPFILIDVLSVSQSDFSNASVLLDWLLAANFLLFIGQTFIAVIDSRQRISLTNMSQFIYNLIYWLGLIMVVCLGGGFFRIGMVLFVSAFIWFLLIGIIAKRVWGSLSVDLSLKSLWNSVIKQLNYGINVYLSGLCGFMFEPLSKILLSNYIGLSSVALFEVATKIRSNVNELVIKVLYPLNPYIASSTSDANLYFKINDLSRKIQLVVLQLGALMTFLIPAILKIWMNDTALEHLELFTIILTLNLLLLSPPSLPIYLFLLNKNQADKTFYIQLVSVTANIIVFFTCYPFMGIYTILLSNFCGYFSSYLLCIYYQWYFLDMNVGDLMWYNFKLLVMCLSSCVVLGICYSFFGNSLIQFVLLPLLTISSSIVFIRSMNLIDQDDIFRYFGTLPYLKNIFIKLLVA